MICSENFLTSFRAKGKETHYKCRQLHILIFAQRLCLLLIQYPLVSCAVIFCSVEDTAKTCADALEKRDDYFNFKTRDRSVLMAVIV